MFMKSHFFDLTGLRDRGDEKKKIRASYVDWLVGLDVDWSVPLNYNRAITLNGIRSKLRAWLARVDSEFLGRHWYERGEARVFAVAVVEHLDANVHLHMLLRMPAPARRLPRPYQSE